MKHTRSDLASFHTVYRDTGNEIGEAVRAVGSALLFVLMIPLHHALWLWLPELSE